MGLFRVSLLLLLTISLQAQTPVCFTQKNVEYSLVRLLPSPQRLLLVNTNTLETSVRIRTKSMLFLPCDKTSHYEKLKAEALAHPFTIANRGMKEGKAEGFALTVDMCPSSKKGFESKFFQTLVDKNISYPITISLTKKWARLHPKEFKQLKEWDDTKALDITWMNHGATHPYTPHVALEKNFINQEGIDFKQEVLDNENFIFREGRTPSIFYRYAGLVSNKKAYRYLVEELGLIPIGTKAWLAKGEKIKERSIVLLHGNKNEPLGIQRFLESKTELPVVKLPQLFIEPPSQGLITMQSTFLVIHIISFISWFAMLFYLPRLFVYHAERSDNQGFIEVVRIMEHKLYKYIGLPAMIATLISGGLLFWANLDLGINLFKTGGWLHAKLLFVFFLVVFTLYLGQTVKKLAMNAPEKSGKFYRILNEVPTLLMILIVVLVIARPF